MTALPWTIRGLREALAAGASRPSELAELALSRTNGNAEHNTYLWRDAEWTRAAAMSRCFSSLRSLVRSERRYKQRKLFRMKMEA
jgi:hypothetical protein